MKAIIRIKAGKEFSTMQVQEIPSPAPQSGEVKVKMASSRINPVDMDLMKGFPALKYKKPQIGGIDGAGTISEIGQNVHDFKVGDKVFFYRKFSDIGTWAEEIAIHTDYIAKIPTHLSPKQAGTIALPLLTAYDSLQQLGAKNGEKILIHGAGGGVGFLAVQIAKSMGLEVIGTASGKDIDELKRVGIDRIIDYRQEQFAKVFKKGEVAYIFDLLGKDILLQSIDLQPKKIVSVHFVVPKKMNKAGVNLPAILKWILSLTMTKFRKRAKRNGVELIGQVTGGNGQLLAEASRLATEKMFVVREIPTVQLNEIEQKGLTRADIGKAILFG
ncbi:MAG TPA: NADP-dependent oxidoreductase [Saprospiraceae bacterium]|nr:NADP-dependent oxidoreductase [Saprospiraceae bacterium]HMP14919.1 NADP-dependent oxidoreductase [Saprospiraceae bacterium]